MAGKYWYFEVMTQPREDMMSEEGKVPENFDWRAFTPEDSPKTPMDVRADPRHQDLATAKLNQGDTAYDFQSAVYDFSSGVEKATGQHFHLAEVAKEKPVALIFGSYT